MLSNVYKPVVAGEGTLFCPVCRQRTPYQHIQWRASLRLGYIIPVMQLGISKQEVKCQRCQEEFPINILLPSDKNDLPSNIDPERAKLYREILVAYSAFNFGMHFGSEDWLKYALQIAIAEMTGMFTGQCEIVKLVKQAEEHKQNLPAFISQNSQTLSDKEKLHLLVATRMMNYTDLNNEKHLRPFAATILVPDDKISVAMAKSKSIAEKKLKAIL